MTRNETGNFNKNIRNLSIYTFEVMSVTRFRKINLKFSMSAVLSTCLEEAIFIQQIKRSDTK